VRRIVVLSDISLQIRRFALARATCVARMRAVHAYSTARPWDAQRTLWQLIFAHDPYPKIDPIFGVMRRERRI